MLSHSFVSDSLRPHDYSLPGSSVHGIARARILKWVAISTPGDLRDLGIKSLSPELGGRFFITEPPVHVCVLSCLSRV